MKGICHFLRWAQAICLKIFYWSFQEKVTQLKTECDDLRSREKSYSVTYQQESEIKVQNALLPYRYLEQEVESLRVVMDLRNQELAQLRQNKREMEKQV